MNLKLQAPAPTGANDPMIIDPSNVESEGNHLYFYSEVEREKILALNKSIRKISHELLVDAHAKSLQAPASLYIHVQSFGGVIFSGLSAMDEILRCPVPVVTVVDGCAASAATFLTLAGGHRQISRNSYMLIHQLSSGAWGNFWQLSDQHANDTALMKKISQIYLEFTKVPAKKLAEVLNHDIWWDSAQCLKYGLVDEII